MGRGLLVVKLIVALAVAVALKGLIPKYWGSFSYVDLPLLITVYFGLMRDPVLGMLVGYAAGLCGDLAPGSGPIVGIGGFANTVVGFVIASIGVRIPLEGPFTRVLVLAVASLASRLMEIGFYAMFDQDVTVSHSADEVATVVGLTAAANVIVGVFIFWLFDKIFPENAPQGHMRVRRRFYD